MEWNEKGFPELNDVCGLGTCPQVKSVISHPQFSEEPKKVYQNDKNQKICFVPEESNITNVCVRLYTI